MNDSMNKFNSLFDKITYGKSESETFDDFLDICICCLSGEQYEEEYLIIIKKYSKEQVNLICELFATMVIIMDNDGAGLKDCLGEYFQNNITRGKNGQFFTPEHVCDFMAAITMGETKGKTIMDPACGSGRMLLSAAKISKRNYFFGADIDNRCCKMAVINLCLNGLVGEISWMNSLSLEHWGGYNIYLDEKRCYVPTIKKLEAKDGHIYQHSLMSFSKMKEQKLEDKAEQKIITVSQIKLEL
jgi:type I restriction-modification system DNA methylase subunit